MQNFPLLSIQGAPVNGTDEIQTLTVSGTPTSGVLTLTYDGETTAQIAYNATALQVQNALQALSNVLGGDVICAGGPLPGTAVTITFQQNLGSRNVSLITSSNGLGGGSNPTISIAETVAGVRGTFRGAQLGAFVQDVTNGIIYQNTGDEYRSVWSEYEVEA
jgi:hypothetical protein